ncbi:hypothetical protein P3T76_003926 [Phytophthora citrophthora]|uniref:Uncharacterized protein n=1 Tax=Phytophthora citrophthora TaxID=4793 RepID=A0AAD9GWK9_9STRA|nr:hypothetical protein P3T76_003926 [Phytophthora citrophthora]
MIIQGDVAIGKRLVWQDVDPDEEKVSTRIEHVLHGDYNSGRDYCWQHDRSCFQVDKSARPFLRTLLAVTKHITHATGFKFHCCAGDNCRTNMGCRTHDFVTVQGVESSCCSFIGRVGGPRGSVFLLSAVLAMLFTCFCMPSALAMQWSTSIRTSTFVSRGV